MLFARALRSCPSFMPFIHALHSCSSFMLFIHALRSCSSLMLFVHAFPLGPSFMPFICALCSCPLYMPFVHAILWVLRSCPSFAPFVHDLGSCLSFVASIHSHCLWSSMLPYIALVSNSVQANVSSMQVEVFFWAFQKSCLETGQKPDFAGCEKDPLVSNALISSKNGVAAIEIRFSMKVRHQGKRKEQKNCKNRKKIFPWFWPLGGAPPGAHISA